MANQAGRNGVNNVQPIDYVGFHRSVSEEINITQNQIGCLLAGHHHLTEGEQREIILRKTLRSRIPDIFSVGRGFVCYIDLKKKD